MNKILWTLTSKYKKLMKAMDASKNNKQRLHLNNGIILDFETNTISYTK